MTKAQERKIRDDERRHIGKLLLAAARKRDCDPTNARVFREVGKVLMRPVKALLTEGLLVIANQIIDKEVAAGRGERITIRGKPGYRAFPARRVYAARRTLIAPQKRDAQKPLRQRRKS